MSSEELASTESDSSVTIDHAARSDIGRRREENQDSFGIIEGESYRLFVVADGMGGVQGGALASSLAIETIKSEISPGTQPSTEQLVQAIKKANAEIFAKGNREPGLSGMGTTFVALFFHGTQLTVFNVGDSRAYRFRGEHVDQLTEDHTLVMELLRSGSIDEEQARNHPVSHMLTRSLGPAEEVEVDVFEISDGPYEHDQFLICSDGLYNLVKDGEMLAIMIENHLENAVEKLIELANKRGGTDNITVIAAETGKGFPPLPEELSRVAYDETEDAAAKERLQAPPTDLSDEAPADRYGAASSAGDASESSAETAAKEPADKPSSDRPSAHLNGSASVEGRLSIEQLRTAYAEAKSQSAGTKSSPEKTDLRSRLGKAQQQPKTRAVRPSVMPTSESRLVFGSNLSAILSIVGAAVCGGMVSVLFLSPESRQEEYSPRRPIAAIGDSDRTGKPTDRPRAIDPNKVIGGADAQPLTRLFPGGTLEGGLSTIEKRQRSLSARLKQVDEKLAALDAPLSGQIGQLLSEASRQLETLDQKLAEVRSEVDSAARRLAVWSGRRKRLETSEPINMVAEVAVSSEDVHKKKEAFEAATWQYLKEAERLEYSPNDPALASSVADLVRQRNQRMDELFVALRTAIDSGILESQQRISDMTVERDRIETDIRSLQDTIAFSRLLSSGDSTARANKRVELTKEREMILAELNELTRLADTLPALSAEGAGSDPTRTGSRSR